ncbi:hypothetical protein Mgra_00006179 [Meloidogyne graminicola]|uniref:Uncharacterized protein n=1 Tax=Meloidogyne graminicola TaxID=189291 RepID=A0A8S9ZLZ9_9BILA|nr:hypothetical protein Mgra_00006179 [Meloidogyne graminicola]
MLFQFLLILLIFPTLFSFNCYQGQTSLNTQLSGSSAACSMNPIFSCTKSIDYVNQIVMRGCSTNNCTFANGTINSAGGCFNSTNNNVGYCCCYADSCNGDIGRENGLKLLIAGFSIIFTILLIN